MYDLIIIGGGPGGYAAAIRASQLGGKVALVEADTLGGTCVNRGCIPSKIWLRAAYLYTMAGRAGEFGIDLSVKGVNPATIVERKEGVAAEIRMGMEALLGNYGVELIRGYGTFKNERQLEVDGKAYEARNYIVATGSTADPTGIPDKAAPLSVDQIYNVSALPDSVLIVGGGPNEVEAAQMLSVFGTKVHLIMEEARILPLEDHAVSQRLSQSLRQQGVEIITRHHVARMVQKKKGWSVALGGAKEIQLSPEMVLFGGRKPNTGKLNMANAGVSCSADGSVSVDDCLRTSMKHIYAIGDVTGGWMLSHAASSMAVTAAENAMGAAKEYPGHLVPRGLWTLPQVAAVGLSEEDAEKQGYDVETGEFPYAINGLAMGQGLVEGAVKIVSDTENGDILGVHIVGENATELIGEAVFAMQLECAAEELAYSIRLHPTYSEAVVDSARDTNSWALYLPKS